MGLLFWGGVIIGWFLAGRLISGPIIINSLEKLTGTKVRRAKRLGR